MERISSFEEAVAFALTLPDTVLSTSYGKPAVKVKSNGRAFLYTGHEHRSSFGIEAGCGLQESDIALLH